MNSKKVNDKKGQISTLDFFMAVLIFSVLLAITMLSWSNYESKISERTEYNDMMNKAFQISDVLVKSEGVPTNWNADNVRAIGLAVQDRNLSIDKVNAFANLSVNEIKSIFQIYGYNFYFNLTKVNGEVIKQHGALPEDVKKSVNTRRYVSYDNEKAVMELKIWK